MIMVCTRRRKTNLYELKEEADFYHQMDIQGTMIMIDKGIKAEGIACLIVHWVVFCCFAFSFGHTQIL